MKPCFPFGGGRSVRSGIIVSGFLGASCLVPLEILRDSLLENDHRSAYCILSIVDWTLLLSLFLFLTLQMENFANGSAEELHAFGRRSRPIVSLQILAFMTAESLRPFVSWGVYWRMVVILCVISFFAVCYLVYHAIKHPRMFRFRGHP